MHTYQLIQRMLHRRQSLKLLATVRLPVMCGSNIAGFGGPIVNVVT